MSTRGLTKTPLSKDEITKLIQVIEKIEEDPQSISFIEPVDYICKFI